MMKIVTLTEIKINSNSNSNSTLKLWYKKEKRFKENDYYTADKYLSQQRSLVAERLLGNFSGSMFRN